MSRSSEVLAQEASFRLIAAACRGRSRLWNVQEQRHASARSCTEAASAARPLLAICADCPITNECREWATTDAYTGIAANTAWMNGNERKPHWTRKHQPGRDDHADPGRHRTQRSDSNAA